MEQKIKIKDKEYVVNELLAIDFDEVISLDEKERIPTLIKKSIEMTDEDYAKITVKERTLLMKTINSLNGWVDDSDFQEPLQQEKPN